MIGIRENKRRIMTYLFIRPCSPRETVAIDERKNNTENGDKVYYLRLIVV